MSSSRRRIIPAPLATIGSLKAAPGQLRVPPAANLFLMRYLRSFPVRSVGGNWIVHSHLPPLNSPAYRRFVSLHLVQRIAGPSHAQVGLTNACPQDCVYCYNKQRRGRSLDTATILDVIDRLQDMGVVWLGFTGGEPLLNRDIVRITDRAARGCAVKLFTTGCGLTSRLAHDLVSAGLFSAAVSLDSRDAAEHDAGRRYPGAFAEALRAIETMKRTEGLHVSVSAVFSRQAIAGGEVEPFLEFLEGLGVDEAWLSEVKPSVPACCDATQVIGTQEHRELCALQDSWNRRRPSSLTVNYLGHFEDGSTFGCNAGVKMVYVDAFGEVSPCVFTPMTFGNVTERPLEELIEEMRGHFSPGDSCWINEHYDVLHELAGDAMMLDARRSAAAAERAGAASPPAFDRILYGSGGAAADARTRSGARAVASGARSNAAGREASGEAPGGAPANGRGKGRPMTAIDSGGGAGAAGDRDAAGADGRERLIRLTGHLLAGTFAAVGMIFLILPGRVLAAFNWLSAGIGLPAAPTRGYAFYLALAVAYMYVVTLLAWMMARRPSERVYPWLLVHAKAASSLLSLLLFAVDQQYLIYIANFVVDGAIALLVFGLCLRRGAHHDPA
jgi:MoaA/NifB/PqqE/SkfB family radical SAM enzyme